MCYIKILICGFLFVTGLGQVKAQATYNRWEARPVPAPQSSRASRTQAQQDSARKAAYWNTAPPLRRGIGQRLRANRLFPEDQPYLDFVRRFIRYPVEALRAQTDGTIWLRLSVDATGRVIRITVAENSTPPGAVGEAALLQHARELLQHLRFEPSAAETEEEARISFQIL
ncbi:energy transducer TonB [Hymenobacter guriensis]|uniref:TonB family protein n=1 Tax=Hymenobacter guriensis TaxID=2793065 RepID=A0ABS0L7W0_9BACT|nr:TonB family protein [Hymenobacter guriensis]MBG8556231.1 TonB family protein [Hymenobacter guriensis]